MLRLKLTRGAAVLASCAAALAVASPAGAGTYEVSGRQIAVDAEAGIYKMKGGLLGDWTITSFEEIATSPYYHAKGTELFKGCIDRRRDRSCKGDPSGTLSFTLEYWALYGSGDPASLVWGACFHPIVSGTGAFAGAQGVVQMVDTPTKEGVKTNYIGNVTLKGQGARRTARAARSTCGPVR
jgi:hypothetical protein